ncbi:MAG: hypothetical protein IJY26_00600 [Clostridia bacterium]|nr:hypothetical protein [Clostridia bacterium]
MTSFFSKHKRSRTILVLVMTFLLSLSLCFIAGCNTSGSTDGDKPDNPSTSKTDNCVIANGNFEYYTDDDNLKLVVAPNSWTNANGSDVHGNTASASTRASGIVNTDEESWDSLTKEKTPFTVDKDADLKAQMEQAADKWEDMSVYDRLHFYEDMEEAIDEYNDDNDDDLSMADFELYSDYEYAISAEDIPDCENPGTHAGSKNGETGVLMIHNYRTDGYGTAQKYTSATTITLKPNTSAKVSVWVKTQDLTYGNGQEVDGTRGANICVTHTVRAKTLDQMQINNIDTKGEWVQYTVYVKACTYASSTFSIVLGLGHGSSTDSFEYVEGYAFFDDVDMDVISNEEYDKATQENGAYTVPYCTLRSSLNEKKFATDTEAYADETVYALDLYQDFDNFDLSSDVNVSTGLTSTLINNTVYTTTNYKNMNISTDDDVTGLTSWNELNGQTADNRYLSTIWAEDFDGEKYPFEKDGDLILLMSAHGAAYTAKMNATSDLFTLGQNEYMLLSFWVKTSDTAGFTGATATLYDQATTHVLGAYNTTGMTTVDLDDKEDIFDGWVQCFFFVSNTTSADKSFRLEFSYGPTNIMGTSKASFCEGYAAFTGFAYYEMTEAEFNAYAGSAPQGASASLVGESPIATGAEFDQVGTIDKEKIESTLADPLNYEGVTGGSIWTGGNENTSINANENAGLLNKNYVGGYSGNETATQENGWLNNLLNAAGLNVTDALTTLSWWNEIFGTSTQPLLISNVVEQSYGYLSKAQSLSGSLSGNNRSVISVRVKVSEGAKAYIYLIDTADKFEGYDSTAEINTVNVTYWYDDDGNVCLRNPEDDDFNLKADTAFYRLDNGLYKNNLDNTDTALYANLANYDKDDDGNLIVETASNGKPVISYDYADDYTDDGIAFYYNEGKYFAYYDAEAETYSSEVKDFSALQINSKSFTAQYARYIHNDYLATLGVTAAGVGENVTVTGKADSSTCIVVDGDKAGVANKWVTVSFYVSTGNDSFPYRLELFSGSRDGRVKSAAGSYVAFDTDQSISLGSNYENLMNEAIEEMTDANGYTDSRLNETVYLEKDEESGRLVYAQGNKAGQTYENAEYYAYTFYEDFSFRRYDKSLDKNETGNPYDGYVQSESAEGLTYLYYETSIVPQELSYMMFLDYNPIDKSISAEKGIDTEGEEEEENRWWEDPNFWLMISSIILAVVLILVVLIMIIIRIVRIIKNKNFKSKNRYNAKRMHYIRKLNLTTEEEEDANATTDSAQTTSENDEANPYND